MRSFFVDQHGRTRFSSQRIAFQWAALLIVVSQGGKGNCIKVAGGGEGGKAALAVVREERQKQTAEAQHPESMSGLLPAALSDALNASLTSHFHFSDSEPSGDGGALKPFVYYKHLFVAILLVSNDDGLCSACLYTSSMRTVFFRVNFLAQSLDRRMQPEISTAGPRLGSDPSPPGAARQSGRLAQAASASDSAEVTPHAANFNAGPLPAAAAGVPACSASSSGTAADVQRQLLRLAAIMGEQITEADVVTVLDRVQRNSSAVDAVIAGVSEWIDPSGTLLVPVAMQTAAKRFLAMLDV